MPSTYMDLTNRLLRRLNEVEIEEADFASVKNIQATAKDCILDTVREINTAKSAWPFNAVETTQVLTVGTEEYDWPADFSNVDWTSFQILKDDALNINHKKLILINREEWYRYLRDLDYDSETDGRDIPSYVFHGHGEGFGISPSPDQAYTVSYRYYKNPTDLSAYNDQVTIPAKFDYVIMAGALYQMNLFKENIEGTNLMRQRFERGLDTMTQLFLPNPIDIQGGVVNFGGGAYYNNDGFLWYRG